MTTGSTKPEWDTPPHGDFASYVERLTAPNPVRSTPSAGRVPPAVPTSTNDQVLPPGVGQIHGSWMGVLRRARFGLLLLMGLQGIALFFGGWGSFAGLIATGMLWWVLGWLPDVAPKILRIPESTVRADTQSLQDRLRKAGPQRNVGKKK